MLATTIISALALMAGSELTAVGSIVVDASSTSGVHAGRETAGFAQRVDVTSDSTRIPLKTTTRFDRILKPIPNFGADRCLGMANLSVAGRPAFRQHENGWECTYLLEYRETGQQPSLFVQIRGAETGVWSSFRVKFKFGSHLSRQVLGGDAAKIVYLLTGNRVSDLNELFAARQDFEMPLNDLMLKFVREAGEANSFNLFAIKKVQHSGPN